MNMTGTSKFGHALKQSDIRVYNTINQYDEVQLDTVSDVLQCLFGLVVPAKLRTYIGCDIIDRAELLRVLDRIQSEHVQVAEVPNSRPYHFYVVTHQIDVWPYHLEQSHTGYFDSKPQYKITITNRITGNTSDLYNGQYKELNLEGIQSRFRMILKGNEYDLTPIFAEDMTKSMGTGNLADYFNEYVLYYGDYHCYLIS